MKVGVWYTSVEEALKSLGLPPNPTEYNPGFLLWETDGKKTLPVVASDSHPIASWCRRSRRASRCPSRKQPLRHSRGTYSFNGIPEGPGPRGAGPSGRITQGSNIS